MEQHIGYMFKLITDKIKAEGDADLKRYGLTITHSRVLGYLKDKGGKATQKEIEVYLRVSHPTVVGIVSRMERNGFVTSTVDEEDRRNRIIALTEKAVSVGEEMAQVVALHDQRLTRALTQEQLKELEVCLGLIYKSLK